MPGPVISVANLSHDYGDVLALDGVTVDVPPGLIGLVGANGAGKTTLIKILLGLLRPTSGIASVMGSDISSEVMTIRSRVGYMPEGPCLPLDQTAADFVGYSAELAGLPPRAARRRASEILFLVGLHEERFRYLGDFSTGMYQRVKLAQAVVHDPELVMLDEPASGLDPDGREEMLQLIERLGEFGMSVLFSSHIIEDIERTCNWVVMLDGGSLLRSGPIEQLGTKATLHVELLGDPGPLIAWLAIREVAAVLEGSALAVETDDPDLIVAGVAATGGSLRALSDKRISLEEAFFLEPESS